MNKELLHNTTLSHYRIVSKIGAGGMGEVYLAQDTKLDRRVAIKFLKEEFSQDTNCAAIRAFRHCLRNSIRRGNRDKS
jgi:serine/threonine protein kinase